MNTYDLKKCIVLVGSIIVTGFGDGDVIDIETNEEAFKLHVGATGEKSRSRINNDSGKAMIKLKQTSSFNKILQTLFDIDKATNLGAFLLTVKAPDGYHFMGIDSFINKQPNHSYDKEEKTTEWNIEIGFLQVVNTNLGVIF